jgi:hypothetical protein
VRCSKIEERGYDYRHYYNKSETLRAGLAALTRLSDDELINLYEGLPLPRKGSITNEEMQARAELEELPRHRRGPQIDYVLDKFDFDGTCAAMRKLKMYWNFPGEKRPRTPTPGELSKKAEELLEIAIEDGLAEDGGLLAIKRMGVLHLIFAPQHQAGTLQPPIETSKQ